MAHIALVTASMRAGGAERVLAFLSNAWVAHGHHVSLITLSPPHEVPFYSLDPRIQLIQLHQHAGDYGSMVGRLLRGLGRVWAVRRALKNVNPGVILSFTDTINLTTLLATRGLPMASDVVVSERIDPAFHPLPPLYIWLRTKIYPWARAIVVQTASAAAYFPKGWHAKLQIIPNAVRVPKKTAALRSGPAQNIVSVGRLALQKGHDVLIAAFSEVAADFPEAKVIIYGEGPERPALEAQIQAAGLAGRIILAGITEDVESILGQADLFVFPSRYEGFPNALLEAMSMGLPVIASACTGVRECIEDGVNGRLVPVGDESALAEVLRDLLSNGAERARLGQAAVDVRTAFSEMRILKMWDEVLQI